MRALVRNLAAAAMVLTRVPMPASAGSADPGRAAAFYPVVGALIGSAVAGAGLAARELWPVQIAAILIVAVEVALTGALHLDGLADCADGLAGRDREHRLRVMKDHSVGVYAAATLVLHLFLKVATLSLLLLALEPGELVVVLAALHAVSRGAMLPLARYLPYAREEGTGRGVVEGLGDGATWVGLSLAAVALVAVAVVDPLAAVVVALAAAATAGGVALLARRTLGGVTGDVLGACAELTLSTMLLVSVAVLA